MIKRLALTNFKSIGKTLITKDEEITEGKLDFAPLTIFCGKNSSGKSTLLQSILLLAQTLQNNEISQTFVLNGPMVKLGGVNDIKSEFYISKDISIDIDFIFPKFTNDTDFFKYSKYLLSTYLSDEELNKIVDIPDILSKLSLDEETRINKNTNLYISFSNRNLNDISNIIPIINHFYFKDESMINDIHNSVCLSASHTTKFGDIITDCTNYKPFIIKLDNATKKLLKDRELIGLNEKLIGLGLCHFLPYEFLYAGYASDWFAYLFLQFIENKFTNKEYKFDNRSSVNEFNNTIYSLSLMLKKYNKNINITNILIPENAKIDNEQLFEQYVCKSIVELIKIKNVKELLGNYIKTYLNEHNGRLDPVFDRNYHLRSIDLGHSIQKSINNIKNYFQKSLLYIGPLREEPRLQYECRIENTQNIGIKGENCAGVIYQNKKIRIRYINPKYFEQNNHKLKIDYCYLLDSVNEWLRYIGVTDSVIVNFNGRYGYELKIKTIDKAEVNDLTNVGVGVSQVLPIVLACLLAPEETTIIIEQPELHLHPAMQSRLTDFFVATMLCNKQLIIETHSEYIINRLRLRAINLPIEKHINDYLKIYFTENLNKDYKDYKKGNTLFRPLEINEYAAMSDWPEGFFDESSKIADEIIKAASKKWEENKDNRK